MDAGRNLWVGVDWATQEHRVCVIDGNGAVVGERAVEHSGDGLQKLCDWLVELADSEASGIRVAIEVPHGAVVETLLERGLAVWSINPKQLDRFRDRFTVAGAKDDRRDARVLADSLRTDEKCFRKLKLDEPTVIELREWSRMLDDLKGEQTRLGNRVREQLRRYYPQMLTLDVDVVLGWLMALWELVPTPSAASAVTPSKVTKVLKDHRVRRYDAATVLAALRATPVVVAPGTEAAAVAHIGALVERLRLVNTQIHRAEQRLDGLLEAMAAEQPQGQNREHRDVEILRSLPGVGRINLATMLAEASQLLRDRDYHALRALTGVAPVTRSSGKSCSVIMRNACHARLRNTMYHWARVAVQHEARSAAKYAELRKRGKTHGTALRVVADRLLNVTCAALRNGTLFDHAHAA